MKEVLKVENVSKIFKNGLTITKAIDNVSFNISEGDFIGIMGPSGSGKSTLLNVLSTIDIPDKGKIVFKDKDISLFNENEVNNFRKNDMGFIFQEFNLIDSLNVFENISLALTINEIDNKDLQNSVSNIIDYFDLCNIKEKYPYEISGGERQRVAVARAIIINPSIIFADEPTGSLDSKSSKNLLQKLDKLNKEYSSTIVMVTHDIFTASYCNKIIFIEDGKIKYELAKGNNNRKNFIDEITMILYSLGGENHYGQI